LLKRRVPHLLASEMAECGLACLAMVASYHGAAADLVSFRRAFPTSALGMSLRDLIGIASRLGFRSRAMTVELRGLQELQLPAIIHWNFRHFVVLRRLGRSHAHIVDPGSGPLKIAYDEFSKHFSGVVLELVPEKPIKGPPRIRVFSGAAVVRALREIKTPIASVLALCLLLQVLAFTVPLVMSQGIDTGISHGDVGYLETAALAVVALSLLEGFTQILRDVSIQQLSVRLSLSFTGGLVHRLLNLPISFFDKRSATDISTRLTSAAMIEGAVSEGAAAALIDGTIAVAALGLLFRYSPLLSLFVACGLAIDVAVNTAILPLRRSRLAVKLSAAGAEQTQLVESLQAISTIRVFGREAERETAWRHLRARVLEASSHQWALESVSRGLQIGSTGVQIAGILYMAGALLIPRGLLTIGSLFAFISFRQLLSVRVTSLLSTITELQSLRVHIERIRDVAGYDMTEAGDAPAPPSGSVRAAALSARPSAISTVDLSFKFAPTEPYVLNHLNLEIADGEFLAICGPSGSGKTTLLKLLLGLYEPTAGQVLVEGLSPSQETWRAWRRDVGVVAQDDRLLAGTVSENISFFDPDEDATEVHQAAELAGISDEILRRPMGYNSLVGYHGTTLSGGQRQRVLLARALYRRPRVLVLDEGTANLDPEAEERISDVVASLDVTRIVVAHRPALIQRADRVITLDATLQGTESVVILHAGARA
jgi:ATP-binding cassette, subfamily B, bacterial CvaB/MchF/RaxB